MGKIDEVASHWLDRLKVESLKLNLNAPLLNLYDDDRTEGTMPACASAADNWTRDAEL